MQLLVYVALFAMFLLMRIARYTPPRGQPPPPNNSQRLLPPSVAKATSGADRSVCRRVPARVDGACPAPSCARFRSVLRFVWRTTCVSRSATDLAHNAPDPCGRRFSRCRQAGLLIRPSAFRRTRIAGHTSRRRWCRPILPDSRWRKLMRPARWYLPRFSRFRPISMRRISFLPQFPRAASRSRPVGKSLI
jgi:hypothetical protein